jgi:phosphomannomutase
VPAAEEPDPGLRGAVEAWIADDPDPASQEELRGLLADGAGADLRERFAGTLSFGTAGLRGPLGAGPTRMNVATVTRVTAGLARHLLATVPGAAVAGVALGHDARHGSARFADAAAAALAGAGLRVRRLPGELPTPVLAFAVRELGCAAGVMVTASHNPPQDNGYKVYAADGAQIAAPADAEIAAAIDAVGPLTGVPLGGLGEPVGDGIVGAYLGAILAALPPSDARDVRVAYTPLHGVGAGVLLEAFARAGFPAPHVVAAQAEPDPDFPTVARPNPEEPGTLDLALAHAARTGADLLLANDPDADRLAVAVPDADSPAGWRVLHGDEIGALLGARLLAGDVAPGTLVATTNVPPGTLVATTNPPSGTFVATTVASSTLLARIAAAAGAGYVETLTGFKWIMRAVDGVPGARLRFGYEEALGYAVNDVVRDKDGISAALLVAQMAAEARRDGRSLADDLADLAVRFGLHATAQATLELPGTDGLSRRREVMAALRAAPPATLLGAPVTAIEDLSAPAPSSRLPAADVVVLSCAGGPRVVVRPSGTEPKLKAYLQVVLPVATRAEVPAARARAARELAALRDEVAVLLQP